MKTRIYRLRVFFFFFVIPSHHAINNAHKWLYFLRNSLTTVIPGKLAVAYDLILPSIPLYAARMTRRLFSGFFLIDINQTQSSAQATALTLDSRCFSVTVREIECFAISYTAVFNSKTVPANRAS